MSGSLSSNSFSTAAGDSNVVTTPKCTFLLSQKTPGFWDFTLQNYWL